MLIFLTSVSPFFMGYKPLKIAFVIIAFLLFISRHHLLDTSAKFYFVFFTYLILALVQGIIWEFNLTAFITSFLIILLLPYLLFMLYGFSLLIYIERFIFIMTIISLVFFTLQTLFPSLTLIYDVILSRLEPFNSDEWGNRSLIIYTYRSFDNMGIGRNSGFSHEPGGFAVYTILGIVINYCKGLTLFNKRNIIYYAALITTFSTAGYLSLAAIALLLIKQKKSRLLALLLFPFIVALSLSLYSNLDFMKEKINDQISAQSNSSLNNETSGRILGARKSLYVLLKYPFYGRGLLSISKPTDTSDAEFADYGWLSYLSHFGLIFGSIYLFYFIKGLRLASTMSNPGIYEAFALIAAIMINLSAQAFINHLFFVIFFYMGLLNTVNNNSFQIFKKTKLDAIR